MNQLAWLDQQIQNQLANASRLPGGASGSVLAPLRNLLARRAALAALPPALQVMPGPVASVSAPGSSTTSPSLGLGGFPLPGVAAAAPSGQRLESWAQDHKGLLLLAGLAISVVALRRRR